MKIGRNEPCPCGGGKKYKNCCLEKDEIQEEVSDFIEKMMDAFDKFGMYFKGSFLEEPVKNNLESIYLQCKYIHEKLDKTIILGKVLDEKKHWIVYRKANIIKKILWAPPDEKVKNGKMFFLWGEHKEEIEPNEFVDLIIDTLASIFEYHISLLRKRETFDNVKLAKKLGLDHLTAKIDDPNSLEELYKKLSEKTKEEYSSNKINSLFNMKSYKIRCAPFHNDYSFEKNKDGSFSIVLEDGRDSINFTELLKLSNDIFGKMNSLVLVPHYFNKGTLPVK